jgi:hypothetical protein
MDIKFYKTHTDAFFFNKKVILLEDLENALGTLTQGSIAKITYKRSGFTIKSPLCRCCGISITISRVPPHQVDLWGEN